MNLEDVRREMRERAGAIKGWAMRVDTFLSIVRELGVDGVTAGRSEIGVIYSGDYRASVVPIDTTLFDVPVVFICQGLPEGVIV